MLAFSIGISWPIADSLHARNRDLNQKVIPGIELDRHALRLVGTAVASASDKSVAIIENPQDRRQWQLREGDHAGSFRIKTILRARIIIDSGDGEATVRMRGFLATGSASPGQLSSSTQFLSPPRSGARDRHYIIDSEAAAAALADPETVLNQASISPGRLLNRKTGFRIATFEPGSIFEQMGLRSGDLILGINDQQIEGPEEALSFIETIGAGGDIDLRIRRRARTYHIHLQIQ